MSFWIEWLPFLAWRLAGCLLAVGDASYSTGKEASIPFLSVAARSKGMTQRRIRCPQHQMMFWIEWCPFLAWGLAGGLLAVGNAFETHQIGEGGLHSLSIGCSKIQRDDTEKDPLSTTPNDVLDRVVPILGMAIGRLLVGGR
jgi:hypothetical protein